MNKNYNAETIETLEYMEHIRRYCGMYVGSKDEKGLLHCVKEILSNSIDEYLNGAGTTISVMLKQDGSIIIKDNGRGIPHGKHPSGCSILQACFGIANTGGKFNNVTGESGYNTSGGEHGTGCKAVNALSTKLIATTTREGIKEIVEFSKGEFVNYKQEKSNEQGVTVQFWPDGEIFETTKFNFIKIKAMMREFSFLCSGLRFILKSEGMPDDAVEFFSTDGLTDYIKYLNNYQSFLFNPIYLCGQDGNYQVEAIVGYNEGYSGSCKIYTNNIPQEKGTHLTGFKTAWTSTLNTWARENKILKDKDANFTGADLEEGQILILSFKMIDPVFKGQNKEELSSSEGRTYVQRLINQELKLYLDSHSKDIKILLDKAVKARKAREAAQKARERVRESNPKNKLLNLPTKLVDANSNNRSKCELFIAEGDSAAGGLINARDPETQAVFPIRGKIINLYKNSTDKIMANAEVNNLIKALGLDYDVKSNKIIYDKKKLRYGKIFTACDADPDGQAIKNLLLTCFWSLCPDLIINGHIWITVPPLFRITKNKDTFIYLKDATELEDYKTKHKGEKYLVNRNKGLGEQDATELEQCLLNPSTRNIKQIIIDDIPKTSSMFEILMGPSVPPRREWLLRNAENASDNLW